MNDMTDARRLAKAAVTLTDDERQRCEVWTRVMGYHRPVASFNIGKKGEHAERRLLPRGVRATSPLIDASPAVRARAHVPPARAAALRLGGVVPFSTSDWPGKLAAVLFLQGCPWRCAYCHNPHLQAAMPTEAPSFDAFASWLRSRVGLLDAVVFSGGEPTAQAALPAAMREVKALGFEVGLHTAGASPRRLDEALRCADWVGFDVKAASRDVASIARVAWSGTAASASLRLLLASGVRH